MSTKQDEEDDEESPVHNIAMRFDDINFEDCDSIVDLLLMLLDGFALAPDCTIGQLIVCVLKESKARYQAWEEHMEELDAKKTPEGQ